MSGNFDYPPASPSTEDTNDLPTRLQQLRQNVLRDREREREQPARAFEATSLRSSHYSPMPPAPRPQGRRRRLADFNFRDSPPAPPIPNASNSPSRFRQDEIHGDRSLLNHIRRARRQRDEESTSLAEAGERLTRISSSLSDLLDPPLRPLGPYPGPFSPRSPLQDHLESDVDGVRRKFKRRKLEHDVSGPEYKGFSYGHYGQVVSGRLKMEIVSCDGGEYHEDRGPMYRAENILQNDKSVYCTKFPRCNLLLRHQGETVFALEKIIIKAPARGFTAPLQEGMIFVSMSSEALLNGTSQYHIRSGSPDSSTSSDDSGDHERLTLLESLQDPQISQATRYRREAALNRLRGLREGRSRQRRRELIAEATRARHLGSSYEYIENCDWANFDPEPTNNALPDIEAPDRLPFTVTTEPDDGATDVEEESSADILADRSQREGRWYSPSRDDDDEMRALWRDANSLWETTQHGIRPYSGRRLTARRRELPSFIERKDDGHDVLAPHARFFIEKDKSRITVKFDPPVSGKFVLLKLWSPTPDGNIDIQSVQAHGFAGPRFFPSFNMK